jgi:thiamine-phosphate pyrophosphorylase
VGLGTCWGSLQVAPWFARLLLFPLLLYYITDRRQFGGNEREQREQLLGKIFEAARNGVDLIQLREKDLSARELEELARQAIEKIRIARTRTRLLVNSRVDVALAVGAAGVHLRSRDIRPAPVRRIWDLANGPGQPIIAVSCHNEEEVLGAAAAGAHYAVLGPIFEKGETPRVLGLEVLRAACRHGISVLALGGIRVENGYSCLAAGAKGIAGIRLFQENPVAQIAKKLEP